TFELERFEKLTDKFPEFHKPDQVFEVSYEKFKQLRKDEGEDPLKALESQGIKTLGDHSILNAVKRNPIERY
uniref:hypothetical protein n=1 Tax=Emticicia sp. TaxID=1930953 RepID=UPI003BA6D699